LETGDVLARLGSSEAGLETSEARRRLAAADAASPAGGPPSLGQAVLAELATPLTPVLAVGAALSAAVGSLTDAWLVGGVVGANALVSAAERLRTERALQRLMTSAAIRVRVRRNDTLGELASNEVVVGDVLSLAAGEVVAADCRILDAASLEVDESALTGESLPVSKGPGSCGGAAVAERSCMLYEGTTVVAGTASAVVVAVGRATEAARAIYACGDAPTTGVEARLAHLTTTTVPLSVLSGAAVAGLSLLRGRSPQTAISSGVGLMVASVPEGLPLLASVAQLAAARRLAARNALVRNPSSIEALGRVDMLCFDKTGTLTEGKICLQRVSDGRRDQAVDALGSRARAVLRVALRATPVALDGATVAHATDEAVLNGAATAGVGVASPTEAWTPVTELPFETGRGFHAVAGRVGEGNVLAVKGAPEVVLRRCRHWTAGGHPAELDVSVREALDRQVERLAGKGLRVLAVAERRAGDHGGLDGSGLEDDAVDDLDFVGFVALADAVRPTAKAAIADLGRAGVEVAMITGDHPATARAIAADLGILNGHRVLTGAELDALDDVALADTLPDVSVFARVTPAHKVRIVEGFQRAGRIVAMTGDGANDAPAIRLAHAGIALGQRGAAPAREAADLVVTDDRIETLIEAIVEGRAMWVSVRDALAILLGGNLGEVVFSLVGTAVTGRSPLNARQLLVVNMLTDLLPAMAIAMRPPKGLTPEALLHEGPEASLGAALARDIAWRGATTAAGAGGAWAIARATGPASRASTVALVALVGTQLGQTMVSGGTSALVVVSSLAAGATLAAIVQLPGVSQFFGCTPLDPLAWATALGAASLATGASVAVPAALRLIARQASGVTPEPPDVSRWFSVRAPGVA
ncbi:MAG: cation-translocating P-type ATPase, partial [Actinomycetota bacterium]|nr:cation-translocating P-type ATPase [Actinomycetota bacterium]